jgi:hypothetical protein
MSNIITSDTVVRVPAGQPPDYNSNNPLTKLLALSEGQRLAAERHFYLTDELHYLFPFSHLELAGPLGADADVLDPTRQDNKTDFQKQNIRDFLTTDTYLLRGWVTTKAWKDLEAFDPLPERVVPFLKLSYLAGPDSALASAIGGLPGQSIRLWLRVNGQQCGDLIPVPYNKWTNRYEIEIWGDHGVDLAAIFSAGNNDRALNSFHAGELITRADLIRGVLSDFDREGKDDVDVRTVSQGCAMHPLLPLHVEVAWANETGRHWDSQEGANYHYQFNMAVRGWDSYLKAGISANPHGGLGYLHYRNLLSNYSVSPIVGNLVGQ